MDKQWIQDIMSQQFTVGTFVNPIRLIMATCLVQSPISNRISRYLVCSIVHCVKKRVKKICMRCILCLVLFVLIQNKKRIRQMAYYYVRNMPERI